MGKIPEDATHWDGGDWIEWHRTIPGLDHNPCSAASPDPAARLTALHINLLRAAKSYHVMTGDHLPVYRQIAYVHAAVYCDVPFEGMDRSCETTGVEILHLPPDAPDNYIEVDLSKYFSTLIVVRINENFSCEARMIQRRALSDSSEGTQKIRWLSLPHPL